MVVGWQYQVYAKDDLTGGNWTPLSAILSGTGGPLSFTNSTLGAERRYYRVRIEP